MEYIVIKKSSRAYKRLARIAKPFEPFEVALNRVIDFCESPTPVSKKPSYFTKNKITLDIIKEIYPIAKDVYHGKIGKAEAVLKFEGRVNPGTVGSYISTFKSMMRGQRYTRTLKITATRYFLEQILIDYDKEIFLNAIEALKGHVIYYEGFKTGSKLTGIRELRDEFTAKLDEM